MNLIIIAAVVLIVIVYIANKRKPVNKADNSYSGPFAEEAKKYENMQAPIRPSNIDEYRAEGERIKNSFTDPRTIQKEQSSNSGRTQISAFAGAAEYIWDGNTLSKFAGAPLLKFDGRQVSKFAGATVFTWSNNCLSEFAGKPIYKLSGNTVSEFAGSAVYRLDGSQISKFAGGPIYRISGNVPVPEAIQIVIAAGLVE